MRGSTLADVTRPRFHLAFPVTDLDEARSFFKGLLGCGEGRSSERWVDFDWCDHQIVAHLVDELPDQATNEVDGHDVPVRHFGLILEWDEWHRVAERLREGGARFLIEPGIRFEGQPGEQATLFVAGPSGNAIELKAFRDLEQIFAR